MTKDEYISQLKDYINAKMTEIQNDGTRKDLKFWVKFNQDKENEFKAQLESQGITVE